HFLPGAGLAGEEHGKLRGPDPPRDADDIVDRLRHPDDVGVPLERRGWPEGGALLLVAAEAIECACGEHELLDGDPGAAAFEVVVRPADDEQRLVTMDPAVDRVGVGGLARGVEGIPLVPAEALQHAERLGAAADQCRLVDASGTLEQRQGFPREDLRMPRDLEQRYGPIECWRGWGEPADPLD